MRLSIALIALACLATGCDEPPSEPVATNPFMVELQGRMAELQADYADFEPNTTERENACRRLVGRMVAMPTNQAQQQLLSDRFAAALTASDEFRMYDGSIMLVGSQVMTDHPPADRSYLKALADKVDNARRQGAPEVHKTTYSSVAVGIIVVAVDYPRRVDTYNDRVNYEQWDRLRTWLNDNLQDLQLDPQDKRYRLAGAPPPQ
ncbi:MAG: hypothetical protein KAU28_04985, partial [Phycisphaerae bacterium]|nr:hypothetical protein [Phycisphaerae bacterium]